MSGSQELLDMFLDLFKNQFPETLQRLEAAVETGDCGAVMREAHTIKSLLQNFFVGHLVRLIHEVEIAGRQLDLSTAQARFASFKYELQRCEDMMIRLPTLKLTAV
jgi:HPt (histidine-containing phosphotransfer) domain-containing protein